MTHIRVWFKSYVATSIRFPTSAPVKINEKFGPFKKLCSGGGISPMGLIRLELLLLEREVESQIVRSGSERE